MAYVSVCHLLPWIFPKFGPSRTFFTVLPSSLYFGAQMMAHRGLESFSNMLEPQCLCVDKMGYVSVGHLLPLDFT
jgi:hypothetical protein